MAQKLLLPDNMRLILLSLFISSLSTSRTGAFAENELHCLASTIYGEARGESLFGKIFVGRTVMTRLKWGTYGRTVCQVTREGQFAKMTGYDAEIVELARIAIKLGPNGYTHFHSYPNAFSEKAPWSKHCTYKGKIGRHHRFLCKKRRKKTFAATHGFLISKRSTSEKKSLFWF